MKNIDINSRIEILCIKGENRWLGIDTLEIKKVISHIFEKDTQDLKLIQRENTFYALDSFFNDWNGKGTSLIFITTSEEKRNIIVGINGEIEIFNITPADIIPLPEYLRNRQDPAFNWGYIYKDDLLVELITFSCFKEEYQKENIADG